MARLEDKIAEIKDPALRQIIIANRGHAWPMDDPKL